MRKPQTSDAACSGQNRTTAQPHNSAGSSFVKNQSLSVAGSISAFPNLTPTFTESA
jgi:hypothetical protein